MLPVFNLNLKNTQMQSHFKAHPALRKEIIRPKTVPNRQTAINYGYSRVDS